MRVSVTQQPLAEVAADVAVTSLFEGEKPSEGDLAKLDAALNGLLTKTVELGEIEGKLHQKTMLHTEGRIASPRLLLAGAGKREDFSIERAAAVAGSLARYLGPRRAKTVAFWLRSLGDTTAQFEAATCGFVMGTFDAGVLKTGEREEKQVEVDELTLVASNATEAHLAAAERGLVLGEAANYSRSLDAQPGNRMTPAALAEEARKLAQDTGLEVDVLDQARMESLGMHCLLSVAQGSAQPPFLIVLRYRAQREGAPTLAVVGKGVTFDSGGISIKPSDRMHYMRYDKSGACTVLGAMRAVAHLRPSINVVGLAPTVENMPGGNALRPGDVVQAMKGKTVEIVNTDAEGRLILADALWYAQKNEGATMLVDIATLTGAIVIALGNLTVGLMGSPKEWVDQVLEASERAGEKMWPLPLFSEYRDQLKSTLADLANVGGRPAGSITAAHFLKEFVEEGVPWVHMDIAGTAYTEKDLPHMPEGPTAVGLRTVIKLIESLEAGGAG